MGRRSDIDGRELLVAAALRLFATHGVDAVSIRAVNREAGLGPASVHYHFGTKEALVEAVLARHGGVVAAELKAQAERLVSSTGVTDARDLVEMLAQPYLDLVAAHSETGPQWVRLVSRLVEDDPGRILDGPSARSTRDAAARVFPDATPAEVDRALRMCVTMLLNQLARAGTGSDRAAADAELLFEFLSAGLEAVLRPGLATESA
ncbi:TetR/AcrR family transcriptional regulator [Nocardioides immobilis]|uniref:TetR/AcrR family transcriptional regulator n=1 Tax=Nocardioides immobilis TaxID=2049295 RepID=A0A417Y106_9ACTN|nr:TetR/AcrR family transcriptional regulator [Nocardioides immobilis]RHW26276.1 TetR/AcrR family transcriptional regulator [Nocardioides immobilis]